MTTENGNIILNEKWLKATVVGSLWAAFEIIVGSLLHNLRMPFAGTLLSAFAVIFLIAFYQLWKERGIILRAGLICALMKSVSPSAVIFGPMIGIISEALLLELIIIAFGKNLFSYLIGGALAVFSALLHKVVNLILLYSFDLVTVYLNIINFAAKKLGLPESSAVNLLVILSSVYLLAGIIAAFAGYLIGKKALKKDMNNDFLHIPQPLKKEDDKTGQYSLFLLWAHLFILIAGLYLSSGNLPFYLKTGFTILYVFLCGLLYKNLFRKLLKPLFWVQLIVILLLASIFLNYSDSADFSFSLAITEGLIMLFRAILVITAFSSIGRELSNPSIKNFLVKNGFHNLYLAIQVAFEVLPLMIERNAGFKNFLKRPMYSFSMVVADADYWLKNLKSSFYE